MEDYRGKLIYFSTFTIENWFPIFSDYNSANYVIYDSFDYLTKNKIAVIYSFVIMPDHIHVIWENNENQVISELEMMFKKHTSKQLKKFIEKEEPIYLANFLSDRKDREYKFWKLKSKSIHLIHRDIILQKIEYIHFNPTKGKYKLVEIPEEYINSSSNSYCLGRTEFTFLTLFESRRDHRPFSTEVV